MMATNGSAGTARSWAAAAPEPPPPALRLPRPLADDIPWNWANRSDQGATALGERLGQFVDYFTARYAWTADHLIPPAGPATVPHRGDHHSPVEPLVCLRAPDATPEAAQRWHTYYLPGFLARLNTWLGNHAAAECRFGNHEAPRLRSGPDSKGPRPVG